MNELLLACRDCGQIHGVAGGFLARRALCCVRCGADLERTPVGDLDRPLAYAAAGLILFIIANAYPLFVVDLEGDQRHNLIVTGALQLAQYGWALAGLGVLVGVLSIIVPGLRLGLVFAVLARLRLAKGSPHPWLPTAWKTAQHLRQWSMLDVYLLGAFVAYTRLQGMVHTTVGVGGYALGALVFVQALLQRSLGRQRLWNAIGNPLFHEPRPGQPWVQCPDCELVVAAPTLDRAGPPQTERPVCPRCAGLLEPRRRGSVATTMALMIAACILYLPANLLPVMTILNFGRTDTNTIVSGVRELARIGMWPLALLVLFASIVVPVLKLVSLGWFLLAIRRGSPQFLRQRTWLYRLIEAVGRWSNIDIFMISILVALMRFGTLTTVDPGPGAVSFAAVVILSMIATRIFDPRLMWDAAAEGVPEAIPEPVR